MVALQSRYDGHGNRLIPSVEGFQPSLCVRTDFDKQCYNGNKLRSRGGPYARQSPPPLPGRLSRPSDTPSLRSGEFRAGREYYVSMCPLRLVPKVFLFNEAELVPGLRAQRVLNRARLPELTNYILANRESYCFSALTASLDGPVKLRTVVQRGGIESGRHASRPDGHPVPHQRWTTSPGGHRERPAGGSGSRRREHRDRLLSGSGVGAVAADVRGPEPSRRAALEVARSPLRPSG